MAEWGSANYMVGSRFDRPTSTNAAVKQKQAQRELLAVQMLEWEKTHTVTVIPYGVSREQQLIKMREGELELIGSKTLSVRWGLRGGTLPTVLAKYDLMWIMLDNEKAFWIEDIKRLENKKDFDFKGKSAL